MSKNLVIVESPAKAKTIKKYLWKDYEIKASVGHIEDLPSSKMWVDVKNNFEPEYEIMKWKKKVITELKKLAKNHENVYLATDEDREWEAISWHLKRNLKLKDTKNRISFHEITKTAIQNAIKNPREINMNLVHAQQWRRILDRLVWYNVSPVLWEKIKMGLSAWRVQSVAVKLLIERENEIKDFKPDEFWEVFWKLEKQDLQVCLYKLNNKVVKFKSKKKVLEFFKKIGLDNFKESNSKFKISELAEKQVKNIKSLKSIEFELNEIKKTSSKKKPPIPFMTSTLQQEASNKLWRWVKQVMQVAQKLYEKWFITYMRTDDPSLSSQAIKQAEKYIKKNFWDDYSNPTQYKTKSKNSQEAHEAIRPTNLEKNSINLWLTWMEWKLYYLIWSRTLASQMAFAKTQITTYYFTTWNEDLWTSKWEVIKFEWFLKIYGLWKEVLLPEIKKWEKIKSKQILANQKFTKANSRYTESSLVKKMESLWIWRPSTYASVINTIITRWYLLKEEKKLVPTDISFLVINFLEKNFPDMMDYKFTAKMEENLDKISIWELDEKKMLKDFWLNFEKKIEKAWKQEKVLQKIWKKCPQCSKELIYKFWRFGKFIACENYPECKYTEQTKDEQNLEKNLKDKFEWKKCPAWWTIVVKKSKKWFFLASSEYPKVKWAMSPDVFEIDKKHGWTKCDKCEDWLLVVRKWKRWYFLGCNNYPKCKNIQKLDLKKNYKDK